MPESLPYSTSVGTLEKMLEKIRTASVPERFTQDFVTTKLSMKGGTAKSCIPFLKKMGFVASDGTPTDLYKEFRNPTKSKYAIAEAFRKLYSRLYEMNEYVHDATDKDIMGLIVECTGGEETAPFIKYTMSTIKMLKKYADFDMNSNEIQMIPDEEEPIGATEFSKLSPIPQINSKDFSPRDGQKGMNLSYTINLNLPPTNDIEVFNAILKSLKQHLLED